MKRQRVVADFPDGGGKICTSERGGIHIEYLIAFMVIGAVAYPSVSWGVIYRLENALRLFINTLAYSFN